MLEEQCGSGETHYVLMDLCNKNLKELVASSDTLLSERELLLYMLQLCVSLAHMHSKGIAHRDLKADNVMLFRVGELRLIDFGCAATCLTPKTRDGNPANMAPEVAGAPETAKTFNYKDNDIWAVGCLVYELLKLKHPFELANGDFLPPHQRTTPPPLPAQYGKLQRFVRACLTLDSQQRVSPQQAVLLLQELLWDVPTHGLLCLHSRQSQPAASLPGAARVGRAPVVQMAAPPRSHRSACIAVAHAHTPLFWWLRGTRFAGSAHKHKAYLDRCCEEMLSAMGHNLQFLRQGQLDFIYTTSIEQNLKLQFVANALRDQYML